MGWGRDRGIDADLVRLFYDKRGKCQVSPLRLVVPEGFNQNDTAIDLVVSVAKAVVSGECQPSGVYEYLDSLLSDKRCSIKKDTLEKHSLRFFVFAQLC